MAGKKAKSAHFLQNRLKAGERLAVSSTSTCRSHRATTPFFISFVEPAAKLRKASCAWQLAVANWAMGDWLTAKTYAQQALEGEPFTLYAPFMIESCDLGRKEDAH